MKRILTQYATRTIELYRQIVVELPDNLAHDEIDEDRLDSLLDAVEIEWELEDEGDFEIESSEWSDAEDQDADPDVVYE